MTTKLILVDSSHKAIATAPLAEHATAPVHMVAQAGIRYQVEVPKSKRPLVKGKKRGDDLEIYLDGGDVPVAIIDEYFVTADTFFGFAPETLASDTLSTSTTPSALKAVATKHI